MNPLFAFGGPYDWIIIAGIVFLFFGNRLPTVMRDLGRGVTAFKNGLNETEESGDTTVVK